MYLFPRCIFFNPANFKFWQLLMTYNFLESIIVFRLQFIIDLNTGWQYKFIVVWDSSIDK